MKERKNVTWRVGEQSEKEKINKWLDKQDNIQVSLSNIVMHMINQFGYVNITDYQVQKQLYGKITEIRQPIEDTENEERDTTETFHVEKDDKKNDSKKEKDMYEGVRSEEHTSELQSRFDIVC